MKAAIPIVIRDHFKNFMKKVLDYERSRTVGRDFDNNTAFKNIVVDLAYNELDRIFYTLERDGIIKECSCKDGISNRKKSYYDKECDCNGTGYIDSQ